MVKIACQTITFGDERHVNNIEEILAAAAWAGYEGVEIGFRRVDPEKLDFYAELLKKNNLKLLALHMGGDFLDPESVKRQMESIPAAVKMVKALGCSDIFISGKRNLEKTKEEYAAEGKNYNELGRRLYEDGVSLSYHNHDWEIINGCMGLDTLMENTDPKYMSFIPDVGWIVRGGGNPAEIIKKFYDRIQNVHFKEFTAENDFTELGRGIVDFKSVYEVMKPKGDFWIVSEQDKSTIGAEESIKYNFEFIKNLIK